MKTLTNIIIVILLTLIVINSFNYFQIQKKHQQAILFNNLIDNYFYKNPTIREISISIEGKHPLLKNNGGIYNEYDLDDYLGYFELLNTYVESDVIQFNWIYNQFGYYIINAYNNKEIKDYLKKLKLNNPTSTYYSGFEKLAKQINQLE